MRLDLKFYKLTIVTSNSTVLVNWFQLRKLPSVGIRKWINSLLHIRLRQTLVQELNASSKNSKIQNLIF